MARGVRSSPVWVLKARSAAIYLGDSRFMEDTTTTTPELRETPALEGDEATRAQAWLEDKVVRAVRAEGYCSEAQRIMTKVFGKPLDTVGVYDTRGAYDGYISETSRKLYPAFLDSDGVDCWGNVWRDITTKLDRNGLDIEGYDKDGYNKDGYDSLGFNRDGFDKDGVHKDDPSRFKYDRTGYDADGFDRVGRDRNGYSREMRAREADENPYRFDVEGYDVNGRDRYGSSREDNGLTRRRARR